MGGYKTKTVETYSASEALCAVRRQSGDITLFTEQILVIETFW